MPATLTIPISLEQLPLVQTHISACVPQHFCAAIPRIELAAEELLVNVYRYAYAGGNGKASIDCREVSLDGTPLMRLSITDWGPPFNPFAEAPKPDLMLPVESRPLGGLGVHLIRTMICHHCYSRSANSNCIELFFDA